MELLILYFGIALIGYFVGSRIRNSDKQPKWTGKVQFVAIIVLVFLMGSRIGAEEEVISNLGELGISAFILTAFTLVGSVLCVYLARKLLGINREGGRNDD